MTNKGVDDSILRKARSLGLDEQIILFTETCVDALFSIDPEEREAYKRILGAMQKLFHLTPRAVRIIREHCDSGIVNAHLMMQQVLADQRRSSEVPPMPDNYDVLPVVEENFLKVREEERPQIYMSKYRSLRQTVGEKRVRLEKDVQFLEHIWRFDRRTRLRLRQQAMWGER